VLFIYHQLLRIYNHNHANNYRKLINMFFFFHDQQPHLARTSSLSRLHEHSQTQHLRGEFHGRVNAPTHRPLPDNTQHSQETDINEPGKIWTHNPSRRAAADPRLQPRGHWNRHKYKCRVRNPIAESIAPTFSLNFKQIMKSLFYKLLWIRIYLYRTRKFTETAYCNISLRMYGFPEKSC
jgi:hypothetical protein